MPDDDAKRKEDAMPRTPAANEIEEDPSLRLLDEIYDGAADARARRPHGRRTARDGAATPAG